MPTHNPRKRFGQHFLHDTSIIEQIILAIAPQAQDHMVEIGPGLGALTVALLPYVQHLDAIELDRDLITPLHQHCEQLGSLQIYSADALSFDFNRLAPKGCERTLRLVGNLPYQISTPLLFHLIPYLAIIQDMHFMLQKEVVDRLAATPNHKNYGRLSVMIQYHCEVEALFHVPPSAFSPPPKVNSAIVRLTPRQLPTLTQNYQLFSQIVKQAFNYRRKTLHNSLRGLVTTEQLIKAGISPNGRAEQLSVQEFVSLTNLQSNTSGPN